MDQNSNQPQQEPQTTPEMLKLLRHTIGAKITAIGFIILILAGNVWLGLSLFNMGLPAWLEFTFILGTVIVIIGALVLTYSFLKRFANWLQ